MIKQIQIDNYQNIDELCFRFMQDNDVNYLEEQVNENGNLKVNAVYEAPGSNYDSLIMFLNRLHDAIKYNTKCLTNTCMDKENKYANIAIEHHDRIYSYGIKFNKHGLIQETLNKVNPDDYDDVDEIFNHKGNELKIKETMFYEILKEQICIIQPYIDSKHAEREVKKMPQDKLIKFFQELDWGVKDININESNHGIEAVIIHTDNNKTNLYNLPENRLNLFMLAKYIIKTLNQGRTLFVNFDKLKIHPMLVRKIIQMFAESDKGQLIFNTMNTEYLSLDLLREDEIWFSDRDDFYSLCNFKDINKDDNIRKGYRMGRYGTAPILNLEYYN